MKRFYQAFFLFCLLPLGTPFFVHAGFAQTGAVQVLEAKTSLADGGGKLVINLTVTNHDQLSELVLVFSNSPATTPLADGNNVVSFMPYHYMGELFLVYSDKKVPFRGNSFALEVDLNRESPNSSFSLLAIDRNRVPSAQVTYQYK